MLLTGAVDEHNEQEEILHLQNSAVVLQALSLRELLRPEMRNSLITKQLTTSAVYKLSCFICLFTLFLYGL